MTPYDLTWKPVIACSLHYGPYLVISSILGLLGAAAQVSEVLTSFVSSFKDAPRLAQCIIAEVEDLQLCLRRLQDFVASENSSKRSRKAMVMVDQLRVVLTHCVMTFSELEATVDALKFRPGASIGNRFRWATKESTISKLLQRLQSSKLSLNLVLTTLTWSVRSRRFVQFVRHLDNVLTLALHSVDAKEAQHSINALTGVVHDVLASNQEIYRRLEQSNVSTQLKHQSAPSALESNNRTDAGLSTSEADRDTWCSDTTIITGRAAEHASSFENDLRQSRVYTRISRSIGRRSDPDLLSLPSSTARSMGSSFLSGLSLADVSNISLISLPIPIQSLSNCQRYGEPINTTPLSRYFPDSSHHGPRSSGKILLLGKLPEPFSTCPKPRP